MLLFIKQLRIYFKVFAKVRDTSWYCVGIKNGINSLVKKPVIKSLLLKLAKAALIYIHRLIRKEVGFFIAQYNVLVVLTLRHWRFVILAGIYIVMPYKTIL